MATDIQTILRATPKRTTLPDERGRTMRFPERRDYVRQLHEQSLITDETDFIANDALTKAVYLDWLRRPQVGCIFAQLLARPKNRSGMRTVVARGSSGLGDPEELAVQIKRLVDESVQDPACEALSVLMPQVLEPETLTELAWELGNQPGWKVERESMWRSTTTLIGLRVEVDSGVLAETLGMGPFNIFPWTRQCPITTLEIRTKPTRAKKSHLSEHLAAHLADIPTGHFLKPTKHGKLFKKFTPWLKRRILGAQEDMRAKASVTYSLPAPIWQSLREKDSQHGRVRG